jgi:hypothetical protein
MERWLVTPESGAVRDRPSEKGSSSYRPSEMGLRRRRQRQDSSWLGGTVKRDEVRLDFIQVCISGRVFVGPITDVCCCNFLASCFWRDFLNI